MSGVVWWFGLVEDYGMGGDGNEAGELVVDFS